MENSTGRTAPFLSGKRWSQRTQTAAGLPNGRNNSRKGKRVHLEKELLNLLGQIRVIPRRMRLDTGKVRATGPMVRGVWGRALRHLDATAYERVFEGRREGYSERTPLYVIRPAPSDPSFAPAVDWILIGEAGRFEGSLVRAWDVASGMGLGADRDPFAIREVRSLDANAAMTSADQRWALREAAEALRPKISGEAAIRLKFSAPLRILRRGKLMESPTFTDIAVASLRRLASLAGGEGFDPTLSASVIAAANQTESMAWQGDRADFVRWSGSQQREMDLHGVTGSLDLQRGAGALWPLLAAGKWVHAGKGTVFGLGQLELKFAAGSADNAAA